MRGSVAASIKQAILGLGCLLACLAAVSFLMSSHVAAQGSTTVGAIICAGSSTVTLTNPVSDSVVTDPSVPIAGTTSQSSQIVVSVDDVFDSVIPLSIGQSSFTGSVQIAQGTHTIKVVAISSCPGTDGSASSVVTYEPPPQTNPSTGGETPTQVEDGSGGVSVSAGAEQISTSDSDHPLFPKQVTLPFEQFAGWLNISISDQHGESPSLSIWRALVLSAGFYLAIIGVATAAVQSIAGIPVVVAALPGPTKGARVKRLGRAFRIFGVILILAALFV
jgi:hypothetical protein